MKIFAVTNLFNGQKCPDERFRTEITVQKQETGLLVTARTPKLPIVNEPSNPPGRLDGLWEYDVAEIFFVGDDGQYVEVELGTKGHYLVLAFDGIRHRSNSFANQYFEHAHEEQDDSSVSSILLPYEILPKNIVRANAFFIGGGFFMSYHPTPGKEADFHQPDSFPEFSM